MSWIRDKTVYLECALIVAAVAVILAHVAYFVHLAWANHRPSPPADEFDRYINVSGCPEEFSISEVGSGDGKIPSLFLLSTLPSGPLWEYRGAEDIGEAPGQTGLVAHKAVSPGLNLLDFQTPNSHSGGTCTFDLMVTGIARGETFVLETPDCQVNVNDPVAFSARLIDPKSGVREDPPLRLLVENGSDIRVGKQTTTGGFVPADFFCEGELIHGSIAAEGFGTPEWGNPFTLRFPTAGIYNIELIFKMRVPPISAGDAIVSKASVRLDVRSLGSTCQPVSGTPCAQFTTVAQELATPGVLGVQRCQPGGGFKAGPETINPAHIEDQIFIYIDNVIANGVLTGLTLNDRIDLAARLQDRAEGCVIEKEQEQVRYYSDPSKGVSHFCDNCCCDRVPAVPLNVLNCSERLGWETIRDCYERRRTEATDTEEIAVLKEARRAANETLKDFKQKCPNP